MLVEELSFEPYAMALPRNDSGYRLEVNKALDGGRPQTAASRRSSRGGCARRSPSGLLAVLYLLNSIPE